VGRGKKPFFDMKIIDWFNQSEDFWSTSKWKCYKTIFQLWLKHATSLTKQQNASWVLSTWNFKCSSLEMIYSLQSGNRNKSEGAPQKKCNLPFHGCVRGSVLWVRRNKAAVKFSGASLCLCFWPLWPLAVIQITDFISLALRQWGWCTQAFVTRQPVYDLGHNIGESPSVLLCNRLL
jgi:hypothetical protein